jgi:hypothetical protein
MVDKPKISINKYLGGLGRELLLLLLWLLFFGVPKC